MIAYEVARLSNTTKIYGINHKQEYNYTAMLQKLVEERNPTALQYFQFAQQQGAKMANATLLERLVIGNMPPVLDHLMNINADLMTYLINDENLEGADTAAQYYERNLKMYANLNQIPMTEEDRVFVIMGGSHIAFLKDFMERSPRYNMVNTLDYLQK